MTRLRILTIVAVLALAPATLIAVRSATATLNQKDCLAITVNNGSKWCIQPDYTAVEL